MLADRICEAKKLTSHSFNNTDRAMLSKFSVGNRKTELFTSEPKGTLGGGRETAKVAYLDV
jgi:hypothetical protein